MIGDGRGANGTSARSIGLGTARAPWSKAAVASLVFGILGGVVFAVAFGIAGLIATGQGKSRRGRGLAKAGIVLAAAWTVLIALLVVVALQSTGSKDGSGTGFGGVLTWLNDPAHYRDTRAFTGITTQILTHLRYSGIAMAIALVLALPIGLLVGHTGRATWLISGANAVRAIPGIGLLVLLAVIISPHFYGRTDLGYLIPTEIVLVTIAIPPILANTAAGIQNVEPAIRDAARGMGMTGSQVLWRVELPNSLPLVFSGVRSATLQVIATATIAAYLPLLGGLGRFIYDGLRQQDFPQMVSGGLLVALLAVVTDLLFGLVERLVVSRGVSRRFSTRGTRAGSADPVDAELVAAGPTAAAEQRVNA